MEANNYLREFHLMVGINNPDSSIITEHLCRNETLSEVTIDSNDEYVEEGELQFCVSSI